MSIVVPWLASLTAHNKTIWRTAQKVIAVRVTQGYRTVTWKATTAIVGDPSRELVVEALAELYHLCDRSWTTIVSFCETVSHRGKPWSELKRTNRKLTCLEAFNTASSFSRLSKVIQLREWVLGYFYVIYIHITKIQIS